MVFNAVIKLYVLLTFIIRRVIANHIYKNLIIKT